MAGQTPPPVAQADPGADVTQVPRTAKERIFGGIGGMLQDAGTPISGTPRGGGSRLEQAVQKHYDSRLNEAKMHRRNATTYAAVLSTNIDPETGKPLTPEQRQQYQDWYNASWGAYQKIAGVTKETKGALAKGKAVLDQVTNRGAQQQQQQPGPVPAGAGATPPAATNGATPPPTSSPQGAPKQMTPPPQSDLDAATLNAPRVAAGAERNQNFDDFARREELLHKYKMEEVQAKPRHLQKTNFKTADGKLMSGSYDPATGKFYDQDDNEVANAQMVTASQMKPSRFLYFDKATGEPRFGFQEGDELFDTEHNPLPPDVEPYARGLTGTETITKDQFGNVTISVRNPKFQPGGPGGPGGHAPARPSTTTTPSQAAPGGAGATPAPKTSSNAPAASGARSSASARPARVESASSQSDNPYAEWGLAPDGTIPMGAGGNEQVRELAQQLLDGADKDKLPIKGRVLAGELARKYGWSQGKFTPKEQVMLREATTFLKQAMDDDSLKALDEGFFSRMKTSQSALTPDKEGYIGRGLSTLSSQHLSEREADFIETYNQLVGTISGLAQLVRSGRATEATIDRLKAELPNPVTTKDSKHAKARLQRLLNEVNVAMEKGTFVGTEKKASGMTPPPAKSSAASKSKERPPLASFGH